MSLALTSSGSYCRPADQVSNILRSDRIQKLGCGWNIERNYLAEEFSGDRKTPWNIIRSIEVRIHDQALPSDRSTRLFEVDSHDQVKVFFQLVSQSAKAFCVFEASLRVMNGAGACDNEKAPIPSAKNISNGLPAFCNEGCLLPAPGNL